MKKILIAAVVILIVVVIAAVSLYFGLRNQEKLVEADSEALLIHPKKFSWCENSANVTKKSGLVLDGGSSKTCAVHFSWNGCVSEEGVCCARGAVSGADPENHMKRVMVCVKSLLRNESHPSEIPAYFGATAGLRLLNIVDSNKTAVTLDRMRSYLLKANMSIREVGIISGRDESLHRWVATNYLRGVFKSDSTKGRRAYGSIDLSVTSAQISYDSSILDTQSLELYGKSFDVYSQIDTCFGTDTAKGRHRTFLIKNVTDTDVEDPCYSKNLTYEKRGVELFWGICTHNRRFTETLRNQPDTVKHVYKFRGTGDPALCRKSVSRIFDEEECERLAYRECFNKIKVPDHRIFLGSSELYSTAVFLNVTRNTLAEFVERANSACIKDIHELNKMRHVPKNNKFQLCFNAQYIVELLSNGYGFSEATWRNIKFVGEVNKQDVTWTLGYFLSALGGEQQKPQ